LLPWFRGLAERFRLIQLDWRGQGMSSRGLREDFVPEDLVRDIEAVADEMGLERFVLMGVGGPAYATIRYAAAHPTRISALILSSFSPSSWPAAMFRALPEEHWDVFLESQIPYEVQSEAWVRALNRLRATVQQRDWLIRTRDYPSPVVEDIIDSVKAPTLILHAHDSRMPSEEECRNLAGRIAGSTFVSIDGAGVLGDAPQGLRAIDRFLESLPDPHQAGRTEHRWPRLSPREVEVLRLIAAGRSNQQIADELVLSLRTVERHITNLYAKIGAHGKADATAYALRHGMG
jgi:pimeloyl-ACP methyl ester carboxylesterase/DNA-binding CsgD family transcriptional regulator